ncbi:MAG: luxQ 1 [Planctomycetaceae bacterium]|nr:luxQ 1 [Planctomycetaceae bacterium]
MTAPQPILEDRVLVLMPTWQDAERTSEVLAETGLIGISCVDVEEVCRELAAGAGIVLLTDEAIGGGGAERLSAALENQPAWSDVPLVVLTRERSDGRNVSFRESANAILVERPVRMRTLLSVVRSALRARRRQYQMRDYLAERQRMTDAVRAERERLHITLASIGDGVISTDAESRVTFLNGVAESLTGWPHDEASGRPLPEVFRIVNEHTRQIVENPAVRALREGIVVGLANHTVLIGRDGIERPIDDSAAPIRDGSGAPVGSVLVFRDVTERKRADEAQARLAAIVESSEDAIVSKTLDGIIRSWNVGAERLFGYTSAEAVGQPITLIVPPDLLDEERDILARLRRGERVEHFETVRMAKDGRLLNISLTISPVRDTDGRVVGASKVARDISQRMRADAALRRSEERYRKLFETMGEGFCVIEMLYENDRPVDYRFLEVNPAFERHTGFKDAVGRTMRELVPDLDAHWFENYGRVADTGDPMRFLSEAKAMGRWYEVSAYRSEGPESHRVAVLFTDVTERKHAAEAIRQRDERIQLFLDNATDYAVIICDSNDRVVEWLGGAERITGWPANEVQGKPVDLIFTSEDRAAGVPGVETARAAEVGRAENTRWHVRRDGSRFFAEGVAVALRGTSGELRGFGKVFRDATAQKLAQEALARDALLLASVQDSVIVTDPEGIVSYWNEGATRLFGWTNEEMLGRHYADRFPEPTRTFVADQIRERAAGVEWYGEYQDYRKDGSHVWIDARVSTVTDAEGQVVGILGVSHDITERKRAEDALRDADRRKDEFIAVLAHELRNPLAPIRNGLQVMKLSAGDPNVVSEVRAMMERQLAHMVRLIDDLLDVSRISRNKMELRRSRVPLAEIVGSAVETARPLIDAGGHRLFVSLPPEPIFLNADVTRLAQVFGNLLSNSAKYTPHGGHIWLTAERSGDDVLISVRDDGIGIPSESLGSVFEMFSQVDRSIERSTGGLGIGLALVKGLVEMHGGSVAAECSGPGRGTTFTVRLPAVGSHTAGESEQPPLEQPSDCLRRRFLVVDDNRDSANSMAMMLRLVGNEVLTAHDGVEAVAATEQFRPQVILMDVGMPKLNGYEATRQIRKQPFGKSITIIALTGWGQEGDRAQSRNAGCDGHLVKPVTLPDLEKLLAQVGGDNANPSKGNPK